MGKVQVTSMPEFNARGNRVVPASIVYHGFPFVLLIFFFCRYLQQSIHGPGSKKGPSEETASKRCIVGSGTDSRVRSE